MASYFEVCIIYCIAFMEVVVHHMRWWSACLPVRITLGESVSAVAPECKQVIGLTSIEASANYAGNSGTSAGLLDCTRDSHVP
jgi:hypothetical protein